MIRLIEIAEELQGFFTTHRWKFCFIGGLALQRWGEQRLTQDVDLSLFTGFGNERKFASALLRRFYPRRPDAFTFALQNRVLLLQSPDKIGIDISFAAMPFEEKMIERATGYEYAPGIKLRTCSSEDLIVMKAFAARPRDLIDIRGVIERQRYSLKRRAILERLKVLADLKEDQEIMVAIKKLFREIPAR